MRNILTSVLFGCLVLPALPTLAEAAPVSVSGAWARATLPHQDEGAAYLTLKSLDGDTLTAIDSPQAGMAMLHQTTEMNGMSSMQDMDALKLPPGAVVKLSPGGTHIMLMDLKQPLKPGDAVHLSLHFTKSGTLQVDVPVMAVGATGPAP